VDQTQVVRLQDVETTFQNKIKVAKAEKSNMFWSFSQSLNSTTYFEKLAT
jgi:hypothetical protein